jgi:quinol monooxygenase YgiN
MVQQDRSVFVVVDIWRVKPGKHDRLEELLAECGAAFRRQPGVLSVDFTRLLDEPDRYLVVFRYRDAEARESFVATPALQSAMTRLADLWDLDSPLYRGNPVDF